MNYLLWFSQKLFERWNEQHHDLRENSQFTIPPVRAVYHGLESILFLRPKTWNVLPDRLKNANSIAVFKMQIKKWKPGNCPCRLCRVYVQNVGFVQENFYRRKRTRDFMWNISLWFYDFMYGFHFILYIYIYIYI